MAEELASNVLVLDSWPVLEWLKGREPAASKFRRLIDVAETGNVAFEMNRINYGEILYSIQKPGADASPSRALIDLQALHIVLHSIDDALVDQAVQLKSKYPFSYADAFAASLAIRLQRPLATGDREFRALEADGLLQLHWLGA